MLCPTHADQRVRGLTVIQRSDRGFTLVEVLMTVVLSTLIGGVATAAMVVGIRNLDDQNARLAGSNDTQLIAGYFTSDVASAVSISTTGTKAHAAPSVTPTLENTRLVSFWSLKLATVLTVPEGMAAGWTTLGTPQFRAGMADESTP